MTPIRVSFMQDGKRMRGRVLAFTATRLVVWAVVEVDGLLRTMRLEQIKVLRGRR